MSFRWKAGAAAGLCGAIFLVAEALAPADFFEMNPDYVKRLPAAQEVLEHYSALPEETRFTESAAALSALKLATSRNEAEMDLEPSIEEEYHQRYWEYRTAAIDTQKHPKAKISGIFRAEQAQPYWQTFIPEFSAYETNAEGPRNTFSTISKMSLFSALAAAIAMLATFLPIRSQARKSRPVRQSGSTSASQSKRPVPRTCHSCGGSGSQYKMSGFNDMNRPLRQNCWTCGGSGKVQS